MISFSQKPGDYFAYIQVEANEIMLQVFRFQERAYDAVQVKMKRVAGDFRNNEEIAAVLPAYIQEAQQIPQCRIIVGFHSGLFSTVSSVVTLRREKPEALIDEAELENIISSGLWKVSSRQQKELAHKLGISEAATVCAGALMVQVRIDGHRVVSPVGFPAHTVELTILHSVSPRAIYQMLAPFLSGEREIYCTEIGASELLRLADQQAEGFLFVRVSEAYTYVYSAHDGELSHVDTISWGKNALVGSLVHELMISREQAFELLYRAETGFTSAHVRRRIESLLLEEVSVLLKGIGAHVDKRKTKSVYVAAPFSLPEALFSEAAVRRSGIGVPVAIMPDNSHGEKTQSALPLSMKTTASSISALCANAWAASRSFETSDLQKITKRRARWLASSAMR